MSEKAGHGAADFDNFIFCRGMLTAYEMSPHCDVGIHEQFQRHQPFVIASESWVASYHKCPECKETIIRLAANRLAPQG
jgi:hypothetical protein